MSGLRNIVVASLQAVSSQQAAIFDAANKAVDKQRRMGAERRKYERGARAEARRQINLAVQGIGRIVAFASLAETQELIAEVSGCSGHESLTLKELPWIHVEKPEYGRWATTRYYIWITLSGDAVMTVTQNYPDAEYDNEKTFSLQTPTVTREVGFNPGGSIRYRDYIIGYQKLIDELLRQIFRDPESALVAIHEALKDIGSGEARNGYSEHDRLLWLHFLASCADEEKFNEASKEALAGFTATMPGIEVS